LEEPPAGPNQTARGALPVASTVQKRIHMDSADRRAQVVRATIRLVGVYGIAGTTIARIAQELGLSEMAAYRHFKNKTEILAQSHQQLLDRALDWMRCSSHPSVIERLRQIGQAHAVMLSSDVEMYTAPMLQFMMTPQGDPFKSEQSRQLSALFELITEIIDEGKAQGSVRQDLNSEVFLHLWISWAQAEDAHYLAVGDKKFLREPHLRMLDLILADISAG
jgi:AcrR family transcriptional regulator